MAVKNPLCQSYANISTLATPLLILTALLLLPTNALSLPSSSIKAYIPPIPTPPTLNSLPLPVKLAGGLFLFRTSVPRKDEALRDELLVEAQRILRKDPLISMELGLGLEAGGVFSSSSSSSSISIEEDNEDVLGEVGVRQLVMEFQINGGNSWAQCRCYGLKIGEDAVQMVSLGVSNMDASFAGGWAEVTVPPVVLTRRTPSSS